LTDRPVVHQGSIDLVAPPSAITRTSLSIIRKCSSLLIMRMDDTA
jgi:hypothetical protein